MKGMKISKPKMPKIGGGMEPGKAAFPRSVSSTTTHALPAMKAPTMPSFDSQVGGVPSVPTKAPGAPKLNGLPNIKPIGGV